MKHHHAPRGARLVARALCAIALTSTAATAASAREVASNASGATKSTGRDAKTLVFSERLFPERQGFGSNLDRLGRAIDVGDDALVAGAPDDDTAVGGGGALAVYRRSGANWLLEAELFGSSPQTNEALGSSVSMDGDTIVAGAPLRDAGSAFDAGRVRVYRRIAGSWTEVASLDAPDPRPGARFGTAVAVSGSLILVGAPGAPDETNASTGAVYAYELTGGTVGGPRRLVASDRAAGAQFGSTVALRGTLAYVGAPNRSDGGAVYGFRYGTEWAEVGRYAPPGLSPGDSFGARLAIEQNAVTSFVANQGGATLHVFAGSGDALTSQQTYAIPSAPASLSFRSGLVAAGMPGFNPNGTGAGLVLVYGGGNELARLSLIGRTNVELGASVGFFGNSIFAGAPQYDGEAGADSGAIALYRNPSIGTWIEERVLLPRPGTDSHEFGNAVSVAGDTVLVGARFDDGPLGVDVGSATVFVRAGASYVRQAKLVPPDGEPFDNFGHAVVVTADYAFVGSPASGLSPFADSGQVYVYERTGGSWFFRQRLIASDRGTADRFGTTLAWDGARLYVSAPFDDVGGNDQGSVYVFERQGASFVERTKLVAPDGLVDDRFGSGLAAVGDRLFVGAPGDDTAAGNDDGAVYAYARSGSTFNLLGRLDNPAPQADAAFGTALAFDGVQLYASAPRADVGATNAGVVHVFGASGPSYAPVATLQSDATVTNDDLFGQSLAAANDALLVGAPGHTLDRGAIYRFQRDLGAMVLRQRYEAGDATTGDRLGAALAIGPYGVYAGSPQDEVSGTGELNAGSISVIDATVERAARVGAATLSTVVATDFAQLLCVRVLDSLGAAAVGVPVTFAAESTDGATAVLDDTLVNTASDGSACTRATANTVARGAYVVRASTLGAPDVTWSLQNLPGPATTQLPNPGAIAQSTLVGTAFPTALAIDVRDAYGNGVPDVVVQYVAQPGANGAGAVLSAESATTNAFGQALVLATANTIAGEHAIVAVTPLGVARYTLSNTPGTTRTVAAVAGTQVQSTVAGNAFAPLALRVTDAFGNGVAGLAYTWTPSGAANGAGVSLAALTATTDANGVARVDATANAIAGGPYNVTATGADGSVTYTLTNLVGTALSVVATAGDEQNGLAPGSLAPIAPRVRVTDAQDNGVAGITVAFEAIAGGGTLTGAIVQTDANGEAQLGSWRLGAAPNAANRVRASVAGVGEAFFDATTADASRDLEVSVSNERDSLLEGELASWVVTIANRGPSPAAGAANASLATTIVGLMPGTVQWICVASGGTCAAPSGTGAPSFSMPLDVAGVATIVITGRVAAPDVDGLAGIEAAVASTFDPANANDEAADLDVVTPTTPPADTILRDGFEVP